MPKHTQNNSDSESNENVVAHAAPQQPSVLSDYSTFDVKRLGFVSLKPTANAKQNVCLPKYLFDTSIEATKENAKRKGTNFYVKVGEIKMSKGGMYPYKEDYHGKEKNCKKRAQFKIAKDDSDKASAEFFALCEKIDKYMTEEINKNKNKNELLCTLTDKKEEKKCKGLTYKPMVQTKKPKKNIDADSDEEDSTKSDPYNYINVQLSKPKEYGTAKDTDYVEIDTQVFLQDNEEPERVKTVTDMEKFLRWNCKAEFVLQFFKVWIQNGGDYECSFGVKCSQIHITELASDSSSSSVPNSQLFSKSLFSSKKPNLASASGKQVEKEESEKEESEKEASEKEESENEDASEPEKEPTPEPTPVKGKGKKATTAKKH
uniref:Uncharacterized protein n=1 Tax=viral metagenome TaxID=1070528 RepID=A0A6C0E2X0_9ZZZZ